MATTFHHVHIKSKDPRSTVKWWADMFDATILPEFEFGTMLFTPVELDGVRINITGHAEEEAVGMADPQPIPYFGLEHVGLLVDDLDATIERFIEDEKKVYVRRPGPGGYEIAFVEAPDGVTLELLYLTEAAS